jgi:hypothetical protein
MVRTGCIWLRIGASGWNFEQGYVLLDLISLGNG